MQLNPRYEGAPLLRFSFDDALTSDPSGPVLAQRRRLADALARLTPEQWLAPSRCAAWTVKDVIGHLLGTDQYWAVSLGAGLAGTPTKFLATFDPVATPLQMVGALGDVGPDEVLARFRANVDALAEVLGGISGDQWDLPGEAPPGHVALRLVVHHALWDAWIHERDVLLPLGISPAEEPDEIAMCLRYAAALGPAFAAAQGSTRTGALAVEATGPDISFVVEAGPTVVVSPGPAPSDAALLQGGAVDLVEALSFRTPHDPPIAPEHAWLFGGLGEVFDQSA